jgi:NAD(P)-dependent dehydrogenase (short-subunit alcohol dehydrogenase family)
MPVSTHQDRVAVVTGAARGFGQAICRQLADRGATVVAVDRDDPTSEDSYFVTAQTIMADGGLVRL